MYKVLNETKILEEDKVQVNTIKNRLTNLVKIIESSPTSDTKKH